ncbi:hypothetical protein BT63DRAFT_467104 [Microthyrium microscopicum]|uniref:DUF6536 domain-containing protein n=1 Tax=Microthyrium microscopicum TaxID=703497 RepID=A0A6A6UPC9_9PEZI|nr:hypothetical protein BT63DRAFT_467104 [Microthyrium microscopicum]
MGMPEGKEKIQVETVDYASTTLSSSVDLSPIEDEGPHYSVFKQPGLWWKHNYLSWRFYTTIYAGLAFLATFTIFLGLMIAIGVNGVDKNGRITVYEGDCGKMKTKNLFAHAFVSGIGTYMLSASCYVMYCLTPPSRKELDQQHSQGRWLDIGAMSLRNLRAASKLRLSFFLLLALSSPLLQLFFNAILFPTYSANDYSVLVAQESYINSENFTMRMAQDFGPSQPVTNYFSAIALEMHQKARAGKLERLDNKECIDQYAVPVQSARRNVILISKNNSSRSGDVFDAYEAPVPSAINRDGPEQYSWLCNRLKLKTTDQCLYHAEHLRLDASLWKVSDGAKIEYCLSEKSDEHCKLQLSLPFCLIVLFVCLFKSMIMFAVAFNVNEQPLMTTGDAIVSYMNRPDRYTKHMCMASKSFIINHPGQWRKSAPGYFVKKPKRWAEGIRTRVIVWILLMVLSTCLTVAMFCISNENMTLEGMLAQGIGSINTHFLIGWHNKEQGGMFRSVFLANIGHVICGTLYVVYNNIFYAMIFQDEWSRFARHKKGLRVSESPRGKQRGVYFFLMPYKVAFPIMFFSCAIHTAISQTLFVVDVEAWGNEMTSDGVKSTTFGRLPGNDFTTTAFAPLANLALIVLDLAMIYYICHMSFRKFKSGVPVVSTCSAAISAALHPSPNEPADATLQELQWGVTGTDMGLGHCTFSARQVSAPKEQVPYA